MRPKNRVFPRSVNVHKHFSFASHVEALGAINPKRRFEIKGISSDAELNQVHPLACGIATTNPVLEVYERTMKRIGTVHYPDGTSTAFFVKKKN